MKNRRTFLAGSVAMFAVGCTSSTSPTTQPSISATAQNALNAIMFTESLAMAAITVVGAVDPGIVPLANAANVAFQSVAASLQTDINGGTALTAQQVADALAAVLAAVVQIHATTVSAKAMAAKYRKA